MTFQEWLETEQGRLISFEHNTLKMLEETWNAARMDAALNHDQRAARAEVERLRMAQSSFLAALDYWMDELHQHGVEVVNVPSRATMLEARAALDAKEQPK